MNQALISALARDLIDSGILDEIYAAGGDAGMSPSPFGDRDLGTDAEAVVQRVLVSYMRRLNLDLGLRGES